MKPPRYLFRMDDITPTMHWNRFMSLMSLFKRFGVKPLLGVVPDNHDPALDIQPPHPLFWDTIRGLVRDGLAEVAQHGYRHTLETQPGAAMIGTRYGIKELSEFAGLSYDEQRDKIRRGRELLGYQGIETNYWMAPNHAFDYATLSALSSCGFTALTDGISLFPCKRNGIICVPQQLWKPLWIPTGVITICLHTNEITTREIRAIRRFLRRPINFTNFSHEVSNFRNPGLAETLADRHFRVIYSSARRLRSARSTASQRFRIREESRHTGDH